MSTPQLTPVRADGQARRTALLLATPMMLFLVAVVAFPLGYGIWMSLTDKSLLGSEVSFVGLGQYTAALSDPDFRRAATFTLLFAIGATVLEVALGALIAIGFNRYFSRHRTTLLLVILPITVAPALMSVMFRLLLNENIGLVTAVLKSLGLTVSLFDPSTVVPTLLVLDVLHWTPFIVLICSAALKAFPPELHEAGRMDGAGSVRLTFHITLPILKPVIASAAFLRFVDTIRIFDMINVLTGGGPGVATQTLSIYIYKQAFQNGQFGLAAAAGVLMLAALSLLIPVLMKGRAND